MTPPVIHPADRLSRLPDEIQAQILSFLPAQEAVRTCLLARAWRHVWKLTRRLFITGEFVWLVREFVDHLLRLRLDAIERASLDECEITFHMRDDNDTQCTVEDWIRRSLECQVQELRVKELAENYLLIIDGLLVSRHLTRLELSGVMFEHSDLNLDGCPALEHLEIKGSYFEGVKKMVSLSLKHLVITECYDSGEDHQHIKICAPRLVSLWLEFGELRAPVLERMQKLVHAHVRIDVGRYYDENYPEGCVLLEGLAQAKDLVLLAHHSAVHLTLTTYTFRRDLRWCPTFSNLKTLVLNGYWSEPADCRALSCILKHEPVLEKLTVIFSEKVELEYEIVWEGRPDTTAKSTMATQCLKTVNVKSHAFSEGVQNVLKFLRTLNIWFQLGVTESSP